MEVFLVVLEYLSDMKGWDVGAKTKSRLYQQICELIDDDSFERLAENVIAPMDYAQPSAILAEVKTHRRQQLIAQRPALPPGTPDGPEICPELARFARFGQQLRFARKSGTELPDFAESWNEPLPDDWEDIARMAIAAPGGPVGMIQGQAMPDPKEHDVVWVEA